VTGSNPYSYLFGPVVALLVVAGLAALVRWAFSSGGSLVERTPRRGDASEYGLLVQVAAPADTAAAELVQRSLEQNGIRATIAPTPDGPCVLVFPSDADQARHILDR